MVTIVQVPFVFQAQRLADDLQHVAPNDWIAHFNTGYYKGGWDVASLRAVGGKAHTIYPDPTATDYADTEILARCPYYHTKKYYIFSNAHLQQYGL